MRFNSRIALSCPESLHKKYAPNAFPDMVIGEPNPILEEFKRNGLRHEAEVVAYIKANSTGWFQVELERDPESQQRETAEAILDPNISIIFGSYIGATAEQFINESLRLSTFEDPLRVSRPDILVRLSDSVLDSWAPVDIKSHSASDQNQSNTVVVGSSLKLNPELGEAISARLNPQDLTQLSHYIRHLQKLGLASRESWAGIIGREMETCNWMRLPLAVLGAGARQQSALSKYDDDFSKATKVIEESIIQNTNTLHLVDVIAQNMPGTYGCAGCDYREVCLDEMTKFDGGNGHITLLARVSPAQVAAKIPGISSIGQADQILGKDKFEIETKIRAEVWVSKIPKSLDVNSPLDLPAFDIEIDIDLENSQEALLEIDIGEDELLGEDRLYLYGYGIHDRTKSKDWTTATILSNSDYSNSSEGEYALMLKTWNLLLGEVNKAEGQGLTIGIFHYSAHEKTWWRRFAQRYQGRPGVPSLSEIEQFLSQYFVDLYEYTRKISFPTMGYSIKLLAKEAGFEWSVSDPGGANSLLKYKKAIGENSTLVERGEAIEWLKSYNEDDVRATFAVRNYLRELYPTQSR